MTTASIPTSDPHENHSIGWDLVEFWPNDGPPIAVKCIMSCRVIDRPGGAVAVIRTGSLDSFVAFRPGQVGSFRAVEAGFSTAEPRAEHRIESALVASRDRGGPHNDIGDGFLVLVELKP